MQVFAIFTLFGMIAAQSDTTCANNDGSCAYVNKDSDEDEVSLIGLKIALNQAKQTAALETVMKQTSDEDAGTAGSSEEPEASTKKNEEGHDDDSIVSAQIDQGKHEEGETASPAGNSTIPHLLLLATGETTKTRLQARLEAAMVKHFQPAQAGLSLLHTKLAKGHTMEDLEKLLAQLEGNKTEGTSLIEGSKTEGTCSKRYSNQFFKPRIHLCATSFTGLTSCTEQGCYTLASFFYGNSCHSVYYSNAESKAGGFGMCRCMPKGVYTINRYNSGAGNNIYSCSSLV